MRSNHISAIQIERRNAQCPETEKKRHAFIQCCCRCGPCSILPAIPKLEVVGAHLNLLGWAPPRLAGRSGQWIRSELEACAALLCSQLATTAPHRASNPPEPTNINVDPRSSLSQPLTTTKLKHRPRSDCRRCPFARACPLTSGYPTTPSKALGPSDCITQPALPHAIRRPAKPPPSRQNIRLRCLCRPIPF